jgi:hypothetical protein
MSDSEISVLRARAIEDLDQYNKEIALRGSMPMEPVAGSVVVLDCIPDVAWWNTGTGWASYDRAQLSWRTLLDNHADSGWNSYKIIHRGRA